MNFVIASLFFTNLWIFLYTNLLQFLNITFPAKTPTEFIRVGAVPEPFEIPFYLGLSLTCVTAIFLFSKLHPRGEPWSKKHLGGVKILCLVFLILLFFSNLGSYPMAHDVYPQPSREKQFVYLLFFSVSMLTAAFIIIEAYILSPILNKSKVFLAGAFSLVLTLIALITLDPHFDIYGHDYSYFFGPVWEIVQGKTIYTQTPSQYGFMSILILALLHKLNIVNALYLSIIVWFFYIVEYFIYFYIIYKVSRSLPLALINLISLITINYLSIYHLPAKAPQVGPLRWLR